MLIILTLSLLSLPFPVRNRGFGLKFSLNFVIYHNSLFTPNFFYNRRGRLTSHKSHKNQCEERFQRDQKCQQIYYPSEKAKIKWSHAKKTNRSEPSEQPGLKLMPALCVKPAEDKATKPNAGVGTPR